MSKETLKNLKETKEGENLKMKKCLKTKKGITLIALVVTIVVLLILAGVSISLVLDKNGIIKKSKDARREYGASKTNEQKQMDNANDWIDEAVTGEKANVVKSFKEAKIENSTIDGKKEGNANNPTIPAGYIPINTKTSKWGNGKDAPSQDAVDHGLVIKDDSGNEWVWIPVPDITVMCDTSNTTEYTLCGTTGETAVKTKLYSKTITIGTDSNTTTISRTMTRTTPGASKIGDDREPDLIVGDYGGSNDAKEEYYKTILGDTGTKEQLAQLFVDEYKAMIESVSKYGGFYIGRYELSSAGVQQDKKPLTNTNWYSLYNVCRGSKLQASDKVKTQMIWGCQWDVTMNWLISSGAKTSDEINTDSSSWGNYGDTSVKDEDGTTVLKASGEERQLNTGATTFTMANNMYDLAGNVSEWTQEAGSTGNRNCRGSYYYGSGTSSGSAFYRVGMYNPGEDVDDTLRFSSYFNNKGTIERLILTA